MEPSSQTRLHAWVGVLFSLKWHGSKKGKLTIIRNNEEKYLQDTLETYARKNSVGIQCESSETKHVVDAIEQQQEDSKSSDPNLAGCEDCKYYKDGLEDILILLDEIKTKQQQESQENMSRLAKLDATMKTLTDHNIEMTDETDVLKSIVKLSDLSSKNSSIKCVLDMKQNEWTQIEEKSNKAI